MNHNTIYITDSVNAFIKASFNNDRPLKIFFVNRISVDIAYKRWQELGPTITIPAENSSTTNNNKNGKFKKLFH